jgi:hypothetical protein
MKARDKVLGTDEVFLESRRDDTFKVRNEFHGSAAMGVVLRGLECHAAQPRTSFQSAKRGFISGCVSRGWKAALPD